MTSIYYLIIDLGVIHNAFVVKYAHQDGSQNDELRNKKCAYASQSRRENIPKILPRLPQKVVHKAAHSNQDFLV
jgi:hypothetical protein